MSLADATAGVKEILPAGLDYSSIGAKFEAVTSREDTHFFPPAEISSRARGFGS